MSKPVYESKLTNKKAITIAKPLVQQYISRFKTPFKIATDHDSQFKSKLFSKLTQILDTQRTTSFHPQSNGMGERFSLEVTLYTGTLSYQLLFYEYEQQLWKI